MSISLLTQESHCVLAKIQHGHICKYTDGADERLVIQFNLFMTGNDI